MEQHLLAWITHYGAAALFGLLALGVVGLPVPNETLLTLAGALVRRGELSLVPTLLAACAGNLSGVTVSYLIGRSAGMTVLRRRFARELARVERWFERVGKWALALGYFVPGLRHVTAIGAGSSGFPYGSFARYAYSGAIVWTAAFLALGYFVGARLPESLHAFGRHAQLACLAAGLGVALAALIRTRTSDSPAR